MKLIKTKFHIIRILPYPMLAVLVILTCIHFEEVRKQLFCSVYDCLGVIIPTLFPFMFLSSFTVRYGLPNRLIKLCHRPMNFLFGLSGNCLTAIITGLTGGYIVSSKNAADLYSKGIIDIFQAKRIALFFTAPGLSFCVFFTGIGIYGSSSAGFYLFISTVLSSLISASVFNLCSRHSTALSLSKKKAYLKSSMIDSVSDTASALIAIISFILLFNFISTVISSTISFPAAEFIINYFAEVTSAIKFTAENLSVRYIAFTLSFGGICIMLQQFPYISKLDIKLSHFILSKLLQAFLTAVIHNIILFLFPVTEAVSSCVGKSYKAFYHSPYGSLSLIALLIIFICTVNDIRNRKKFFQTTNYY